MFCVIGLRTGYMTYRHACSRYMARVTTAHRDVTHSETPLKFCMPMVESYGRRGMDVSMVLDACAGVQM